MFQLTQDDEINRLARYRLLASAIAGKPVEVEALAQGDLPFTDGETIFVGRDVPPARRIEALSVQAALVAAGSLEPEVVDRLLRRPTLVARYLAIEGHRALSAQEHLLPPSARRLIDRSIAASVRSPAESLAVAVGRATVPEAPNAFGTIRPKSLAPNRRSLGLQTDAQIHDPRSAGTTLRRELDDAEELDPVATHALSSPVGGSGMIGRLLKRLFGDSRLGGGDAPGADTPTYWTRRPRSDRPPSFSTMTAPAGTGATFPVARNFLYPEWDSRRRRYRPEWCTVREIEPASDELAPLPTPDPSPLRRALGRLGMELERQRRQTQGDDIDIDAAIEAQVELAAGSAPEEAVYIDTVRCRRDLSILLLLDISGSAGESSSTGVPVHTHQTAATAALSLALSQLGDRVAVYGFRSQGRSAVDVFPVKRFEEVLGALAMRRLEGLVPGAYTRLGAAIRHGSAVLDREGGTSRRILVVLSDGFAYDHGYEPFYGEADARRALGEVRRRGLGCLCLSVGAASDSAALRRVFGTAAHAVVPRVEQLPAVVGPLFRSSLRSAEAQRRVFRARQRMTERLDVARRSM